MRRKREKRPRKYIPMKERLAAALACLLPQSERDDLRARRVPAESVIRLFEQDHIALHALDGSDKWWNLTPAQVRPHREKSRRDTSIVAKVKRLQAAPQAPAGKPKTPRPRVDKTGPGKRATGRPTKPWGRPMPGTVASGWRRRFDGTVEKR